MKMILHAKSDEVILVNLLVIQMVSNAIWLYCGRLAPERPLFYDYVPLR